MSENINHLIGNESILLNDEDMDECYYCIAAAAAASHHLESYYEPMRYANKKKIYPRFHIVYCIKSVYS